MSKSKELIFVDTGAFFALHNSKDECHEKAVAYKEELIFKRNQVKLITTKAILYEILNLARKKLRVQKAIEMGNMLYHSKFIEIHDIDNELEKKGWDIYQKYTDKKYSFTDCTSFAFMKANKIKKAFAFDGHFKHFGFELVV